MTSSTTTTYDLAGAVARSRRCADAFADALASDDTLATFLALAQDLESDVASARALLGDLHGQASRRSRHYLACDLINTANIIGRRTVDLSAAVAGARDRAAAIARATADAHTLASVLARAEVRAWSLAGVRADTPILGQPGAGRITPAAVRLLDVADRLLPMVDRARYAEEFRTELWELARAGAGRRGQLRYACRQVLSARRLRSALRAPRRRRATP